MTTNFASTGDTGEKKITFSEIGRDLYAFTAEGDPNSGVIVGDDGADRDGGRREYRGGAAVGDGCHPGLSTAQSRDPGATNGCNVRPWVPDISLREIPG